MSENSIQGNSNWYLTDGEWVSDQGADLSVVDDFASGNPPEAYLPDHVASGGNPFMGGDGGNVSTTSEDGNYTHNYTRTADERSLAPDDNNPFGQLMEVMNIEGNSLDSGGNPFASGNNLSGDMLSSSTSNNTSNGNSFSGSSETNGNPLPEAPEGLTVPYSSEDWISDLKNLESGEPGATTTNNTGNGNGNWFYGSDNTANGNGNWYFSTGNTGDGNGNWYFGISNTSNGNGNWYFGISNTSDGNGNWQLGNNNTVNGNGNIPSGYNNNILGNSNVANVNDSSLLGNSIEATEDGKTYIGNEDWSFDILSELTSLGSGVSGVGDDVTNLLNHPDLISTTMSKEGFTNSSFLANDNYQHNV